MDFVYNILDELSGNTQANEQVIKSTADGEENRRENGESEERSSRPRNENNRAGNFASFESDVDEDLNGNSRPWHTQDSRQWESHTKSIEGEFSRASNPEQTFKISKNIDLDPINAAPNEGWLNLDDFDLRTSPSDCPPPSRPAPVRDIGSGPSTSGHEHGEGNQTVPGGANRQEKEQFLTKIVITRRISYELVEEDIYDDQPGLVPDEVSGEDKQRQPDLIDISTVDLDGNVTNDKNASELSEKAAKQLNRVTKAIEEDLSALFGDTSTSKASAVDRKGKGKAVVTSHTTGSQQPSAAVAEMRERDSKRQREMEEVSKAADELQSEFKRWSAGKEGNLRALLSSLQAILGPEFGWKPIPMTDLLESASVRKQYKRATLLVHPDKLQQKGATPRQKYIAEQVFGLLKEASKKFNSEELF